jgi:catechol 2,3-dioxygenase-like lactoylglutathione lyase family enzyme
VAAGSSGPAGRELTLMRIDQLDHLVLTVVDVGRTAEFYERVLGMRAVAFAGGRGALRFGNAKINLHQAGQEFEPKAAQPIPGSADICLITPDPLPAVCTHLAAHGVTIEEGPVTRTGATGPISSVYIRDPDGNLIEISNYLAGEPTEA